MSTSRPKYTKTRGTKVKKSQSIISTVRSTGRKTCRFHGAFTGGFSAGYFNSVGSKCGWKPSDLVDAGASPIKGENQPQIRRCYKKGKRTEQKIEDFMDEQDANEWGGPTHVQSEYQNLEECNENIQIDAPPRMKTVLKDNTFIPHKFWSASSQPDSLGRKLLCTLGWKTRLSTDGTTTFAYIPLQCGDTLEESETVEEGDRNNRLLISRRLKRIELKLKVHHDTLLPPPKTNTYGIGYEPFQNAPEFRAHRRILRERAEMRTLAATSSCGSGRMNVYRTSDLYDGEEYDNKGNTQSDSNVLNVLNQNILTHETTADFVGTKTVGGFALHDDSDDVYDNSSEQRKGLRYMDANAEYDNEVYDASDSDVDDFNFMSSQSHNSKRIDDARISKGRKDARPSLTNNQSSFAGALNVWASAISRHDKPNNEASKSMTSNGLYPLAGFVLGGDICQPKEFLIARWPGPGVPPNYTVTKHSFHKGDGIEKVRELSSIMKREMEAQRRKEDDSKASGQDKALLAGSTFLSLSDALKKRFTTSKGKEEIESRNYSFEGVSRKKGQTYRTVIAWQPHSLLCKRFHVPTPRVVKKALGNTIEENKKDGKEEIFFRSEILRRVGSSQKQSTDERDHVDLASLSEEIRNTCRPPVELLKSIFEPESEDDMDISSEDDERSTKLNRTNETVGVENKDNVRGQPFLPESRVSQEKAAGLNFQTPSGTKTIDNRKKISGHHNRKHKINSNFSSESSTENDSMQKVRDCFELNNKKRRRKKDRKRRRQKSDKLSSSEKKECTSREDRKLLRKRKRKPNSS